MTPPSLDQLRDIHLPDDIFWWPPAPGWWLLAVVLLSAVVVLGYTLYARRRQNYYRRQAQAELCQLRQDFNRHHQTQRYLQEMLVLLRRLAKTAYPDKHWHSLPAGKLLDHLGATATHNALPDIDACTIDVYIYANRTDVPIELTKQVDRVLAAWINQHRSRD